MSPALWYFSRATGLVSLALFTVVVVLGCVGAGRFASPAWSRLTTAALHRNLALTTLVFLGLHIASAVIDSYVSLAWIDVVVPFVSAYQPFWVGLGATAIDLMLAIVITSLLRTRISPRVWRAVHWLAYLCWPVALVHGDRHGRVRQQPRLDPRLRRPVRCGGGRRGGQQVHEHPSRHRSPQTLPAQKVIR